MERPISVWILTISKYKTYISDKMKVLSVYYICTQSKLSMFVTVYVFSLSPFLTKICNWGLQRAALVICVALLTFFFSSFFAIFVEICVYTSFFAEECMSGRNVALPSYLFLPDLGYQKRNKLTMMVIPSIFMPEDWSFTFYEGLNRHPDTIFKDKIVAELGCGNGWISIAIAERWLPSKVMSPSILMKCWLKYGNENFSYRFMALI